MLDELKGKNGKDFDASYDQTHLKAHQDAVALFDAYAKRGEDAELKGWAFRTLTHLQEDLSMAEKLKLTRPANWTGDPAAGGRACRPLELFAR
jgi:putative membrane protein